LVVDREGSLLPTGYAASTLHTPEITIPLRRLTALLKVFPRHDILLTYCFIYYKCSYKA
jgi:hypothetical protein